MGKVACLRSVANGYDGLIMRRVPLKQVSKIHCLRSQWCFGISVWGLGLRFRDLSNAYIFSI